MLDTISMWKNSKMITYVLLTAVLYFVLLYPFQALTFFEGYADFGRIGVGIPIAFSFFFGPAAAWGSAIGNIICDIAIAHVDLSSCFGLIGNFLLGYIPYKLWTRITDKKPDLKSFKKFTLFTGIAVIASTLCAIVIALGLYWLGYAPFLPTLLIISVTNSIWAVSIGGTILILAYDFFAKRNLIYAEQEI
jgi:energy-coupling factor transport system substrate-specific component